MWGQSWINIYDLVEPYPNATSYDVTKALRDQVRGETNSFSFSWFNGFVSNRTNCWAHFYPALHAAENVQKVGRVLQVDGT